MSSNRQLQKLSCLIPEGFKLFSPGSLRTQRTRGLTAT